MTRPILLNIPTPKANKLRERKVEKDFESDIFTHLRKNWYMCYHPADEWLGYKYLDWVIDCPDWSSFRIEFKKTDWFTFNMSQFEPNQIVILEYFLAHGNEAYVMVYSKKTKTYWIGTYEYLKSQANSVWWIKLFA